MVENHGIGARRQAVIFEEPPTGGFSRAIWLEYANRQTFKGDESGEFPHEVGLFLSYPPEAVKGFIDHRANGFKYAGLWKVYGDEEKARSLFVKYKKCTEIYCALWQSGLKLEQLAVAGNGVPAHVRCVQAQLRREACGTVRLLRLGRWRVDVYLGE